MVLPVAQPFTARASPSKEPLLGPSGGSLTHRRISYARMGPPLPKRHSSDEPDTARSVSEFDWGGDMTTTSQTVSRSRRSSVSEHAFPQVTPALHNAAHIDAANACMHIPGFAYIVTDWLALSANTRPHGGGIDAHVPYLQY